MTRKATRELPRPLVEVFDTEHLARLERATVVHESPEGTEYLIGVDGGILYVPRDQD